MDRYIFRVDGIDCERCMDDVQAALRRIDGVRSVRVDVAAGRMWVGCGGPLPDWGELARAIRSAGFTVHAPADHTDGATGPSGDEAGLATAADVREGLFGARREGDPSSAARVGGVVGADRVLVVTPGGAHAGHGAAARSLEGVSGRPTMREWGPWLLASVGIGLALRLTTSSLGPPSRLQVLFFALAAAVGWRASRWLVQAPEPDA